MYLDDDAAKGLRRRQAERAGLPWGRVSQPAPKLGIEHGRRVVDEVLLQAIVE